MQFFSYNLIREEKFIQIRIRTKVVFRSQEIFEQPCMDRVFSEFLNRKFLSSQAMAKRLNQEKRKLPQSFVLSILPAFCVCSFLNRTSFQRTILSLVYSRVSRGWWMSRGYAWVNLLKHYIPNKKGTGENMERE